MTVTLIIVMLLRLGSGPYALAEDEPARGSPAGEPVPQPPVRSSLAPVQEETQVRVFQVQDLDAMSCADVIHRLGLGVFVAADEATGTVVVSGTKPALALVEQAISGIRKAAGPGQRAVETHYFPAPTPVTEGLLHLVRSVVSGGTEVTGHESLLVVTGPGEDMDRVGTLLAKYSAAQRERDGRERPRGIEVRVFQVSFYFMRATLGVREETADVPTLPDGLEPVGAALTKVGLRKPALLGTLVVSVGDQEKFDLGGLIVQDEGALRPSIRGFAALVDGQRDRVTLEVNAALIREHTTGGSTRTRRAFELSTGLSVRLGDFVLLAVSPGHSEHGDSVALVARVTPVE